jgi:hypothetical protein
VLIDVEIKLSTWPLVQAKYSGVFAGRYVALLFAVTTAVEPTVAQTGNVETTRIWMSPHSDLVFDTRSRGRFRSSLQ